MKTVCDCVKSKKVISFLVGVNYILKYTYIQLSQSGLKRAVAQRGGAEILHFISGGK